MFLLNVADKNHNHLKTTKQNQSLDVASEKVNLNILRIKKCVNHAPTKPSRKIHWGVSFQWSRRLKAYNFPKNKPPKRHFSQSLLKREEDRHNRTSFLDTSDRDILWITGNKKNTVEPESRNFISFAKPSAFEIKSSIESKNSTLLFGKWILNRQLMLAYTKSTLERLFTYLLALISRSNLAFGKWRWTFTPFFNSFLFL